MMVAVFAASSHCMCFACLHFASSSSLRAHFVPFHFDRPIVKQLANNIYRWFDGMSISLSHSQHFLYKFECMQCGLKYREDVQDAYSIVLLRFVFLFAFDFAIRQNLSICFGRALCGLSNCQWTMADSLSDRFDHIRQKLRCFLSSLPFSLFANCENDCGYAFTHFHL